MRIGLFVADITAIDDAAQTIELDLVQHKSWRDPRLAGLEGCRFPRASVWYPTSDLLVSSDLNYQRGMFSADQVRVQADGLVIHFQRRFGEIATNHHLRNFPFDRHRFRIRAASLDYPIDQLIFEIDDDFTQLNDSLNIPDWKIENINAGTTTALLPAFGDTYSIYYLDIFGSRAYLFYVLKIMFPLLLIVLMSFSIFWLDPGRFGPNVGLAATSMLTLIAFQFALANTMPKVSYMTILDGVNFGSTALVFGALVVATATSALVTTGKAKLAARIDRTCRWLFPFILIMAWAALLTS